MIKIRRSDERGHADYGWLDTRYTFSFNDYYDPAYSGFRSLRVINEDRVEPGRGFGTHPHRDMEILTYVLEGELEHRDSMGTGSTIRPGEVQRMSAGSGVTHSEFNHSQSNPVHLLQIWILPERKGIEPSYEQKELAVANGNGLSLIASPDGAAGSVRIHQDAKVFRGLISQQRPVVYPLGKERHAWVQVARGEVEVNGNRLQAGDGAALTSEAEVKLAAANGTDAEILLFDLN